MFINDTINDMNTISNMTIINVYFRSINNILRTRPNSCVLVYAIRFLKIPHILTPVIDGIASYL